MKRKDGTTEEGRRRPFLEEKKIVQRNQTNLFGETERNGRKNRSRE